MVLVLIFVLGVANFAMHKAVLESGHPMIAMAPWYFHMLGGRVSLAIEFMMLLGTMLMVAYGAPGWAWFYGVYSLANGASAWLILSGRV